MRRWDRRDTEVETETVGAPARPPAEAEILALQRSAGNRAVAAQIQRLKIGGERISDDSRVTAAMAELNEIASEQPASRPFLEKRVA